MQDALRKLEEPVQKMNDFDPELYRNAVPPLVSLYVPVSHDQREMRRDEDTRIAFKNLKDQAEATLAKHYPEQTRWSAIADKLAELEANEDLPVWTDAGQGLAFLVSNKNAYAFSLSVPIEPTVVVGENYYIKPLLRNKNFTYSYYLLALCSDRFGLIRGNQDGITRIELPPEAIEVLNNTFPGLDGTESALDNQSVNGHESPYHLWRSRNDVKKEEADRFFRQVNSVLADQVLKGDKTPVILVSLPEHQSLFRKISTLPQLLPQGIEKDPDSLSGKTLKEEATKIMDARVAASIAALADEFHQAVANGKGSDDFEAIGQALLERKVKTLLVQRGKGVPGTYTPADGTVHPMESADGSLDPTAPDIIDEFAQAALGQKAQIYVIPPESMPTKSGVAAIYRY